MCLVTGTLIMINSYVSKVVWLHCLCNGMYDREVANDW
jgi:hypothetical protein